MVALQVGQRMRPRFAVRSLLRCAGDTASAHGDQRRDDLASQDKFRHEDMHRLVTQ